LEEAGEEFARLWLDGGKKSTVNERPDGGRVAIFAAASTRFLGGAIFREALVRERLFRRAPKELALCDR
jgi:hypothetical protein